MDAIRNRKFVAIHLLLALVATAAHLALRYTKYGSDSVGQSLIIFCFSLILCFLVFRKISIARWLFVVFYGFMGLVGLLNIFSANPSAVILSVASGAYAWCALVLARSGKVKEYFACVERHAA